MSTSSSSTNAFLRHLQDVAIGLAKVDTVRSVMNDLLRGPADEIVMEDTADRIVRMIRWSKGQLGDWHDHDGRHGSIVVLRGTLVEAVRLPAGAVDIIEHRPDRPRAFVSMPTYIHKISNPSTDESAVSLHVYYKPASR